MRDLQAEVLQRAYPRSSRSMLSRQHTYTSLDADQGVIDLLREQLATKTGETVEARDRIAQLEQSQAAHQLSLEEREQERKEARAREEGIMSKRAEMQDQLDAALVRAAEREKGLEEKEQSLRRDLESALESKATSEAAVASLTVS